MSFVRAVKAEQKQQRQAEILQAAARLFSQKGWDNVSFNGIAREVGLSKSNLYRYYSSKGEIFLTLITEDFEKLADNLLKKLENYEQLTVDDFALVWTISLLGTYRFLALVPLLSIDMERHSSKKAIKQFRSKINGIVQCIAVKLHQFFPTIDEKSCYDLIMLLLSQVAGLYPMTQYTDEMKDVLKSPHLSNMHISFATSMKLAAKSMLLGMLAQ